MKWDEFVHLLNRSNKQKRANRPESRRFPLPVDALRPKRQNR
jgi:hypothetical protein